MRTIKKLAAILMLLSFIFTAVSPAMAVESTWKSTNSTDGSGIYVDNGSGNTASGYASTAMGYHTNASSNYSTAMGFNTTASGDASTAMGEWTNASSIKSVAMGDHTSASGAVSLATGYYTHATGNLSVTMGYETNASGEASVAMGRGTTSKGDYSTAMGFNTTANGKSSFAGGSNSAAYGANSFAFGDGAVAGTMDDSSGTPVYGGNNTIALGSVSKSYYCEFIKKVINDPGSYSTEWSSISWMFDPSWALDVNEWKNKPAEEIIAAMSGVGGITEDNILEWYAKPYAPALSGATASGDNAIAIGTSLSKGTLASGKNSAVFGNDARATAENALALGTNANASGIGAVAIGNNNASGDYSTAMGKDTNASGNYSVAMGFQTGAYGNNSVAMGLKTIAEGHQSFAVGSNAKAMGSGSVAMGSGAQAHRNYAVAMGWNTNAVGMASVAIGTQTNAGGTASFAGGAQSKAYGDYSFAFGNGAIAGVEGQAADYAGTIAFGSGARATHANSVALGNNAVTKAAQNVTSATIGTKTYNFTGGTSAEGVISIGNDGHLKQIVNVANGAIESGSTDAVNGGQIFDIISNLPSGGGAWTAKVGTTDLAVNSSNPLEFVAGDGIELSADNTSGNKITIKASGGGGEDANAVHYNADKSEVALKGTEGTAISNVKAAELAEGGTYAATTGQLYAEQTRAQTVERHLQSEINANAQEIREVGAISAALAGLHFAEPSGEEGDKLVGAVAYGGYRGANAEAIGLAYKPNPNMMLSASTSISNGNDSQNAYNVGFSLKFGKGETAKTKAELQKQVKYLNDKNSALESTVAQQGTEIQTLKNELEELKKLIKK